MKVIYKYCLLFILLSLVIFSSDINAQASISIDHVDGLILGKAQPDTPIKFHLRYTNNTGNSIIGVVNGFTLFLSNNGELENGTFGQLYFDNIISEFGTMFDLSATFNVFSNGMGGDTVGIAGIPLSGTGFLDGYDNVIAVINTSMLSEHAGDSLCIDSTYFGSTGVWKWISLDGYESVYPDWSGPHCYEILPSCCVGMRGNFNNSPDDQIDISDLVFLVNYMFFMGAAPLCEDEADFNADGNTDIADLIALVEYMHFGGAPPADCQ